MVTLWRASLWLDGARPPWSYLAALAVLAAIMAVQGYLGGELVYRFGVEVEGRYRPLPTVPESHATAARPPTASAETTGA
jgi:hypothetical protein